MKSRRSRHIPSKWMLSGFGSAFVVMGTLFILPQTAIAEVRTIRLPEDMCTVLREEPLNERIVQQIRDRADFARILSYVENTCGELGGLLIGPTGSIAGAPGGGGTSPEGDNGFVVPGDGGDGPGDDEGEGPGDDEGDGEEPTFPDTELEVFDAPA
jgi:hypothetical protein